MGKALCEVCYGEFHQYNRTQRICSNLCKEKDRNARSNQNWVKDKVKLPKYAKNPMRYSVSNGAELEPFLQ